MTKTQKRATAKTRFKATKSNATPARKRPGVSWLDTVPIVVSDAEAESERQWAQHWEQTNQWHDGFEKLVGLLIRFGETAAQRSDGTQAFVCFIDAE